MEYSHTLTIKKYMKEWPEIYQVVVKVTVPM